MLLSWNAVYITLTHWATITSNGSPYAMDHCPVCPVCL